MQSVCGQGGLVHELKGSTTKEGDRMFSCVYVQLGVFLVLICIRISSVHFDNVNSQDSDGFKKGTIYDNLIYFNHC